RGKKDRVIKGLAHITGGGFIDNIPRVLPKTCDVLIEKNSWPVLPIFELLRDQGGVDEQELYQVFNMGIGMTAIVAAEKSNAVLQSIRAQKHKAWIIGKVSRGQGIVKVL
ncbi:MAG: AIR synthase-related protein, partial [Limisphaerales bacterium]